MMMQQHLLVAGQDTSAADDLCVAETGALNTNSELSAATTTLLTTTKESILADFTNFCKLIGRECAIDISDYSTEFRDLCVANQGQFYEQTYALACTTDTVSPFEIPGTVKLQNLPACLGASCDPDILPAAIEDVQQQLVTEINTDVDSALGDSVACEVSKNSDGSLSTTSGSAGGSAYSMGGKAIALGTTLALWITTTVLEPDSWILQ
jgi:hypothetical protein